MRRRASIRRVVLPAVILAVYLPVSAQNAPTDSPDALGALEAAVSAAADDLRAGNDYRMAVIASAAGDKTTAKFDRAIAFFEKLIADHPDAANAHLNHGFAYVDKIPAAGAITQVILASRALGAFSKSLELRSSWIGLYTRGNSYLFWPTIFGRTKYGIADLEEAMKLQHGVEKRSYHVRTYIALGDGYWKMDELPKAVAIWREGLEQFPDNGPLKKRLTTEGNERELVINEAYDPYKRVDTNLQELWANP
jgi:tetratricopeptide (TPR) repeat protein